MRQVGVVGLCVAAVALTTVPAGPAAAGPGPAAAGPGPAVSHPGPAAPAPDPAAAQATAAAGFAHLPLRFEVNQGQADPGARFVVRSGVGVAYLTAHDAVLTSPRRPAEPAAAPTGTDAGRPDKPADPGAAPTATDFLRLTPAGARPDAAVSGVDKLPGASNYLIGNDPTKWHTDVPAYARVRYTGVYRGVDLVWHGEGGQLEYDFEVAAGADPAPIAVALHGGDRPTVDAKGDLVTHAGGSELRQHAPVAYQEVNGARHPVDARFAPRPDGTVGFALGTYDRRRPLVIDPTLSYATYLGGGGDDLVGGVAIDASNSAYATGWTQSVNFPVTAALQPGCDKCPTFGAKVAFVTKLDATGTAVAYSTYLGGTNGSENVGNGPMGSIAVDPSGSAYVSGSTSSSDFPITGGFKATCGWAGSACSDAFVAKLGPSGSTLAYSSFIGGSNSDLSRGLALGAAGVVYVGGSTSSADFLTADPGSATPLRSSFGGGGGDDFVVKVNTAATGPSSLVYATYLGGVGYDEGRAVAADPVAPNVVYVAGWTTSAGFPTANGYQASAPNGNVNGTVSKIDTTAGASGLSYSSYLGGTSPLGATHLEGLVTKAGVAYLTGDSANLAYPTTGTSTALQPANAGGTDAVVTAVDTTLTGATSLRYSTYLGGTGNDYGKAVAVDAAGLVTVAGKAVSGFPLSNQFQNFDNEAAVFVARLDTTLGAAGLVYSTALTGDAAYAVAVDGATPSTAYVGGWTWDGFPTTAGAAQAGFGGSYHDGFVAKLGPGTPPPVVTGLSVTHGPFSGGTAVVVSGVRFSGATAVRFGTVAVAFTAIGDTQISVTAPCATGATPCPDTALSSVRSSSVAVTVTAGGLTSVPNASARYTYGEGDSSAAARCSACLNPLPPLTAALPNGKVLVTQTSADSFGGGTATSGSTTFTSDGSHSFASTDVGKRFASPPGQGCGCFPPGTFVTSVVNSTTITLSNPASASGSALAYFLSNNVTALYDPAADSWATTGPCHGCGAVDAINSTGTITVLASGKVLVAGGTDPFTIYLGLPYSGRSGIMAVRDAFLYDPAAGTWSATGSMSVARKALTATLLADGRVLVAGGSDSGQTPVSAQPMDAVSSAEVFDPAANGGVGAFSATGSMATPRALAAAARLPSGKVLVAGGYTVGTAVTVASAEQYDPATGTWAPAGSMSQKRGLAAMVALPTSGACGANCGKAVVINGETGYDMWIASTEVYTPGSPGSWTTVPGPSLLRAPRTVATMLPGGKVLVTDKMATLAERFDPASGGWASAGANLPGTTGVALAAGPSSVCASHCGHAFVPSESTDPTATSAFYIPRPVISGVGPPSGGPGTTVTVTGTGLTAVSAVSFGGVAGTGLSHSTTTPDTSLTVSTPSGVSGAATLIATSTAGTSSPAGPQFSFSTNVPTAVQNLAGQAMDTAAVLTWSPPASNGGAPISSYAVTVNAPVGGAAHASVNVNPATCSPTCATTISGLSNSLGIAGQGAYTFTVVPVNANGNGYATTSAPVFPQLTAGQFSPLAPARILDTRNATGTCFDAAGAPLACGPVGAGATEQLLVAGAGGVPASGASAVAMNVTVTGPSAASVLTVFPSDAAQPPVSNLNYTPAQTVPNLVVVKLGPDGRVKINNAFGTTQVVADVVGWYSDATTVAASRYNALAPARILDTRSGTNAGTCVPSPCATLGNAGVPETIDVAVAGAGGVPASGASAVVLNATVTNPSTPSVLTVWPSDVAQPNASNLNYTAAQTVPNAVMVKLGPDGKVKVNNAFGSVDVIFDVVGWYAQAGSITGARFTPVTPGRILDTRPAPDNTGTCVPSPCAKLGAGSYPETADVAVAGRPAQGGAVPVPASGVGGVIMNVTVTAPDTSSVLTVWPSDVAQPTASNLNYVANQTVPNLVAVKLGATGKVKANNAFGAVHVIFDVNGWFNNGTS